MKKTENKTVKERRTVPLVTDDDSWLDGSWWDRVPEEDKKRYNRTWLFCLYSGFRLEVLDWKAVMK